MRDMITINCTYLPDTRYLRCREVRISEREPLYPGISYRVNNIALCDDGITQEKKGYKLKRHLFADQVPQLLDVLHGIEFIHELAEIKNRALK